MTAPARDAIVELRQYTLHRDRRDDLIALFERAFVEPQDAVGAHVLGLFRDLDDPERFVWLRGFASMAARFEALTAFYGGPVWRAHRDAANDTMRDSDNVLLLRPAGTPPPEPSGNDRTSFIVSVDNQPGSLLGVLAEIAGRGINMTRLESRPTRNKLGEYVFLIDADGHIAEPAMADTIAALIRRSALMRWLGSYPRMSGTNVPAADFATAERYDAAAAAVSAILTGPDPGGPS